MVRVLATDGLIARARGVEVPTLLLVLLTYAAFATLTWYHAALPWWLILPLGAFVVCLHGSLQHEAVHGHPTRSAGLNEALVFPSLWLWMPYRLYRRDHTAHHATGGLTDPIADTESFYWIPEQWARLPAWAQAIYRFNNTLIGRLLVGPALSAGGFWVGEWKKARQGEPVDHLALGLYGLAVAVTLIWVLLVCRIGLLEYILLYAYPGTSLTLLRSYLEHQAHPEQSERTVIVEAEAPVALMFLNNNLHAVHHSLPREPWYRLPAIYRADKAHWLGQNGAYHFAGYREVFKRFAFRAKEPTVHPASCV